MQLILPTFFIDNTLTRRELFDVLYERRGEARRFQVGRLFAYLVSHYQIEGNLTEKVRLRRSNYSFCSSVFSRIDKAHRSYPRFLRNNTSWLDQKFTFSRAQNYFEMNS